jgi:NADP-dependent 3-hydroxy acid dehydrogenase YdfG
MIKAHTHPIREVQALLDLNVIGTLSVTKAALPHMLAQPGGGMIVVTSSVAGKMGYPISATYSASKFALHGYFDRWRLVAPLSLSAPSVRPSLWASPALSMELIQEDQLGCNHESAKARARFFCELNRFHRARVSGLGPA